MVAAAAAVVAGEAAVAAGRTVAGTARAALAPPRHSRAGTSSWRAVRLLPTVCASSLFPRPQKSALCPTHHVCLAPARRAQRAQRRASHRIQGPVINLGRPCISLGNMQVAVDPTVNLSGARVHLAEPQITFK